MRVAVTILAFCVTSLLALGLVMLYSSSMVMVDKHTHSEIGAHMLQMQMVWCVLGFIACAVVAVLDYELLKKIAWPVFIAVLVLASLVFIPHVGMQFNGARRWIRLPGATFQPSEIVKIALIIMLAWYGDRYQRKMHTFKWGILFPVAIIAAILGLVFVEPDRGTTILLAAVGGTMLILAGVRWMHLIPPVLAASQPAARRRFLIRGTAAATSSTFTVTRTSSEPASASSSDCLTVLSTSAVSVFDMDCTTTGAPPPTWTFPTRTPTVPCRARTVLEDIRS